MNEPTPEEAAAALHAVHEGREQVIRSALRSPRWLWISGGLIVFVYCTVNDLFPVTRGWLTWVLVAVMLLLSVGLRTRVGGTLFGRSVAVSGRSLPVALRWRLLRIAPIFGLAIAVTVLIQVFHVPHGEIYYGALAGLYIIFLGPRFQLWLLRRQDQG